MVNDQGGQFIDGCAPGLSSQVGTGTGDGKVDQIDECRCNGMSRQPDPDFSGSGRKIWGQILPGIKYERDAAWPVPVNEFAGHFRYGGYPSVELPGVSD